MLFQFKLFDLLQSIIEDGLQFVYFLIGGKFKTFIEVFHLLVFLCQFLQLLFVSGSQNGELRYATLQLLNISFVFTDGPFQVGILPCQFLDLLIIFPLEDLQVML